MQAVHASVLHIGEFGGAHSRLETVTKTLNLLLERLNAVERSRRQKEGGGIGGWEQQDQEEKHGRPR